MSASILQAPVFAVLAVVALLVAEPVQAGKGSGPLVIKVEIEGVTQGLFDVVEGLQSESEVLAPDDENPYLYPAPGPMRWSSIILKRTYDPQLTGLWNWRRSVVDGSTQRRDGRIMLFDSRGRLAACWVFTRGWPSRWEVTSLKSSESDPGTEIIEIVHEGLGLEG